MKKLYIVIIAAISVLGVMSAQGEPDDSDHSATIDTLRISLDDCLQLALGKGPAVQSARFDSAAAAGRWRTIRGERYPQLSLSGDLPRWSEQTDNTLRYDPNTGSDTYRRTPSGSQMWQTGIDIGQELPWGATISYSTRFNRMRYFTELSDTTIDFVEYGLNHGIVFDQPLLAGNPVGRKRKIGEINWKNSLIDYELQRRSIRYRTTQAFFRLVLSYGQLDIDRQDLEQGRQSAALAERKYNAGLIPEVELLQIQIDVARRENEYRQSSASLEASMDQLRLELGLPFNKPIFPTYETPEDPVRDAIGRPDDPVRPNDLIYGERLEQIKGRNNLDRQEMETRTSLWLERIQASLEVYYELDTYRERLEDLDQSGDRNVGVTLRIDLPLYDFGSTRGRTEALRASLAASKVDLKMQQAQLISEMRDVLRSIELAAEQIRIADAGLELSRRSYEITTRRFESGLISSRDLLDAQIELTRTRREALSARIDYELALANLQRIAPPSDLEYIRN